MSARDWAGRLHLPTLAALVVVLAGWTLLARRYGAFVLPSPWSIVTGLVEIVRSGEIWGHAGASLGRIAAGFGSAVAVSLLMGLGAFVSRTARGSNWAPIFTTFMITLPVVASTLVEGVASVDRRLLEMGDVYRLSGPQKFTAIVIPSTLPYLVAGMKVGFGLALKVSVVAEIFGVTSGIGYAMNYSREILATRMVFVWALVMILIMVATDKLLFDPVNRRLTRWR